MTSVDVEGDVLMDFYAIAPEDFAKHRNWPFHFVKDSAERCARTPIRGLALCLIG
jgi:hypothetical protein